MFHQFPRKKSTHQYLFGYQSIGGVELANPSDPEFNQHSVIQLFVDSAGGIFCSGERKKQCIVTGIFYEEPNVDEDFERLKNTCWDIYSLSKEMGYDVFRNLLKLQPDQPDPTKDQLVKLARSCDFVDFRVRRRILDVSTYSNNFKGLEEPVILYALLRQLIFSSTKVLPSHSYSELIQYDTSMHKKANLYQLTSVNSMYVVTRGPFTCPAKSFFVFAHN